MAILSHRQFLKANFGDEGYTYDDYVADVLRQRARMMANLVSSVLCFLVMSKSFLEVSAILVQIIK